MRILILIGFLAFMNGYVAMSLVAIWPFAGGHLFIVWLFTFVFFALQLAAPFGDRLLFPGLKDRSGLNVIFNLIDWASYAALGILSCLFIYTLSADIISTIWKLISLPNNGALFDRRQLFLLAALTFGTIALGIKQAASGPTVRTVEIPLDNLPANFDGFKIVQISDLHVGSIIGRDYTENVVTMANNLKPDLIALTGDFVDGSVEDLRDKVAPLAKLHAPYGVFFVTGNHEYYWGAGAWIAEFAKLGARILSNEHIILKRGNEEIILAGINDYSTRYMQSDHASDPGKALEGSPSNLTKILLAHQPASYKAAHAAGFDLQISGHTHGGQYFPFNLFIRLFQRYYKGLNRHENMWIYVNRGTGFWGPPLRTANPSEITLIILRRRG